MAKKRKKGQSGGMRKNAEKRRDLKFLWHSNSIYTNSGYAVESRDILLRLKKDGWDFAFVANHGVESYPVDIMGIKHYPRMADPHGSDAIFHHALDFGAQVVFTMLDVWILDINWLRQLQQKNIKWIPWVPVDQEPANPGSIQNIKTAYKILTLCKFGQETLEKEGFASTLMIEGIDTQIFKPMDKAEMRKKMKIPNDIFLFGMIGANKENPPRKGYQEAMDAFKLFSENHPEARLFFHCQQLQPNGFPIVPYANQLGIQDKVLYLDQYRASFGSSSARIAEEINMFDVTLHPSMTEGFGLLSIESQSCGVPVIINRCTSMPELVVEGKTGWICDAQKAWWRNGGGYTYFADTKSLHEKMEELYNELQKPNTIAKDCRDNVLQNYDISVIVRTKWIPFLEELQDEILPKKE